MMDTHNTAIALLTGHTKLQDVATDSTNLCATLNEM